MRPEQRAMWMLAFVVLLCATPAGSAGAGETARPHVVVATLDTGVNPFHPVWRRDQQAHPSKFVPGYPTAAAAARLSLGDDFARDVATSADELRRFGAALTWVPGTNIIGAIADPRDGAPVFDAAGGSHAHGAAAASQIAGRDLGFSPDTYVVVADRTTGGGLYEHGHANARLLRWAADQPWIDVIHVNWQEIAPTNEDAPEFLRTYPDAFRYAVAQGKLVVVAGGNFAVVPTQLSPYAGQPGVLVAGANDNCGFTTFSNPNPDVVSDGAETVAAAADGYGTVRFGGTSSASPRVAGYAAELLLRVRRHFGIAEGMAGDKLVVVPEDRRPATGPIADGALTAAELHEVVRVTASPRSHPSRFDGAAAEDCVPEPPTPGPSHVAQLGYGEVSEHTIDDAFAVAIGAAPRPDRAVEDGYFAVTSALRAGLWGQHTR